MKTVELTPGECRWAQWALDGMDGLTDDDMLDLHGMVDAPRPTLTRKQPPKPERYVLTVGDDVPADVVEDLLYRLERQAPTVSETDATSNAQAANRCAKALTAAKKIRNATERADNE